MAIDTCKPSTYKFKATLGYIVRLYLSSKKDLGFFLKINLKTHQYRCTHTHKLETLMI